MLEDFIKLPNASPDAELFDLVGTAALKFPEPECRDVAEDVRARLLTVYKEATIRLGSAPQMLTKACGQWGILDPVK